MTRELPLGWEWASVEDVCDVMLGQSPPGSSYNQVGQGVPFLQGKAEFGDTFPTIKKWTTEPKKFAQTDSVLVSVRAPVGPTNVAPLECAIGRGLASLKPRGEIPASYLLWAMRHSEGELVRQATGSTFEAITGKQLRSHVLPVAPLPQQQQIVAAIEEHFSRLDAVEAAQHRIIRRVKVLKSSLLSEAFGTNGDLPPGWGQKTIGEVAQVQLGRQRSPQHHSGPQMRPYLRSANVTWEGVCLDDVKEMNFDDADFETYRLEPGDLLLNEASGSPGEVGKPVVWDGEVENCCFQNTLLRVRSTEVNIRYLYWYCFASALSGRFGDAGRGVNIRHLGKGGLAQFPIPVAPSDQQGQIAAQLDQQFEQTKRLEQAAQEVLNRVAALRQAVLAQAFAGKLVPQDPDDEPASALLERIAASR